MLPLQQAINNLQYSQYYPNRVRETLLYALQNYTGQNLVEFYNFAYRISFVFSRGELNVIKQIKQKIESERGLYMTSDRIAQNNNGVGQFDTLDTMQNLYPTFNTAGGITPDPYVNAPPGQAGERSDQSTADYFYQTGGNMYPSDLYASMNLRPDMQTIIDQQPHPGTSQQLPYQVPAQQPPPQQAPRGPVVGQYFYPGIGWRFPQEVSPDVKPNAIYTEQGPMPYSPQQPQQPQQQHPTAPPPPKEESGFPVIPFVIAGILAFFGLTS